MNAELRAYSLRQQAEARARQIVPLAGITEAVILDKALSIMAENMAAASIQIEELQAAVVSKDGQSCPVE